jgi:hypothetical protein
MSKPKNLQECAELVRKKEPFTFNNMYGQLRNEHMIGSLSAPPTYTVYSYGGHYPMYVYDYEACQWYGNADKSTATTERHKNLVRPYSVAQWVDNNTLQRIAYGGIVNTTALRMMNPELFNPKQNGDT